MMRVPQPANILLEAALTYIARGWPVFPLHTVDTAGVCTCRKADCGSPGKHPRTRNGLTDATLDPATVKKWWLQWPSANVAVRTGAGLVVLDVDPESGGSATLAQLEAEQGALPRTYEVVTGRGGRHLYFMAPAGVIVPNSASLLGPGLDVRGDGGYVVAPPSMTTATYTVDAGGDDSPLVLPEWLLRAAQRRRSAAPPVGGEAGAEGAAADAYMAGGRNSKLTSLGGTMRVRGMSHEAIEAALLMENARRCRPPLDEVEVKKIAASVMRYEPYSERSWASQADPAPWEEALIRDTHGRPKKTFGNVCAILRNGGARLSYDEMRMTPMLDDRPMLSVDMSRMREHLEQRYRIDFGGDLVREAVLTVSDETRVHPVREYLEGLAWDGEARIARVPAEVLGLAVDGLTASMLRRWFISAVARIMQPGCQVDTVLVLVGKQGARKSTFFRELAGAWFGESKMDISNKDAVMQLYAAWIYEWPEVDSVTLGRDSSEIKGFLTQRTDTIRKPYAPGVSQGLRHTVIVGTTNQEEYLDDETGARRFWTLSVGAVAIDVLRAWRDQLWAEALVAYRSGEQWWLDADEEHEHVAHSGKHAPRDPWTDVIAGWLERRAPVSHPLTASDVISHALNLPTVHQTKKVQMRVCACLKALGYRKTVTGPQRVRSWEVDRAARVK